ncbi:MAG: hypothetical protein HQL31_12755, partial [Planctomycetes bacterium]|nr:hypothetical protein [Planctomycetota bacterium]
MTIGIYINQDQVVFSKKGKDGIFDHLPKSLQDEDGNPLDVKTLFIDAQEKMQFTTREDFRIVVDFPLCHVVAQMVPFAEKRLAQVLENYLEEELPADIDMYFFSFRVIRATETGSSVLGFWIRRSVLDEWCDLAEELSLNSLDIQPAELALLPGVNEENRLFLRLDHNRMLRYSCFLDSEALSCLSLGRIPGGENDPEAMARILNFSGPDGSKVDALMLSPELEHLRPVAQKLGIENCDILRDEDEYRICSWAVEADEKPPFTGLFNFRKEDYAPRGAADKVLIPAILLTLSLTILLLAQSWSIRREAQVLEGEIALIKEEKLKVAQELYPKVKFHEGTMKRQLEGFNNLLDEGVTDESAADVKSTSALQDLGLLFKYIDPKTKALIERLSISKQIRMQGSTEDIAIVDSLRRGFGDQILFKIPDINIAPVNTKEGETPKQNFTFTTARQEKATP